MHDRETAKYRSAKITSAFQWSECGNRARRTRRLAALESRFLMIGGIFDYERDGRSLFRMCETTLRGWRQHRAHPDERVRIRFEREVGNLRHVYGGMLWAMERSLKGVNRAVSERIGGIRKDIQRELGSRAG